MCRCLFYNDISISYRFYFGVTMKTKIEFDGRIADKLNWFVPDTNYSKLNNQNLREYAEAAHMKINELAKILNISRTSMYSKSNISLDAKTKSRLLDLAKISDMAFVLFNKNKKEALKWVVSSNDRFIDNLSPFEMALCGKGKSVIFMLEEWGAKEDEI